MSINTTSINIPMVVTLAAGKTAIGTFTVSETSYECGWLQASDLKDAVTLCESLTQAWGAGPDSCYQLCDSAKNKMDFYSGVCVNHSGN